MWLATYLSSLCYARIDWSCNIIDKDLGWFRTDVLLIFKVRQLHKFPGESFYRSVKDFITNAYRNSE